MMVLEASRKKIKAGDLFVFQMSQEPNLYRFGLVSKNDFNLGPFPNCNLVYLYEACSESIDEVPELNREKLLIPPFATNNLAWSKGYFLTISNIVPSEAEVFSEHYFRDTSGNLYNESGVRVKKAHEPVGIWALRSYRTVDDSISEALGIPLVPEDE